MGSDFAKLRWYFAVISNEMMQAVRSKKCEGEWQIKEVLLLLSGLGDSGNGIECYNVWLPFWLPKLEICSVPLKPTHEIHSRDVYTITQHTDMFLENFP